MLMANVQLFLVNDFLNGHSYSTYVLCSKIYDVKAKAHEQAQINILLRYFLKFKRALRRTHVGPKPALYYLKVCIHTEFA